MCFGCSKELSHRDGSFEYPQHMFLGLIHANLCPICPLVYEISDTQESTALRPTSAGSAPKIICPPTVNLNNYTTEDLEHSLQKSTKLSEKLINGHLVRL